MATNYKGNAHFRALPGKWYEICAYCGHEEAYESESDVPPPPDEDDDEAWAAISAQHGESCDWARTRAHSSEEG